MNADKNKHEDRRLSAFIGGCIVVIKPPPHLDDLVSP